MNTVLIVLACIVTVAIVIAVVFLIDTLMQVKRVAVEAETLLKNVNQEVSSINRITDTVIGLIDSVRSPWVKAGLWFAKVASNVFRKKA